MRQRKRMWIDVDEVLNEYRMDVLELAKRLLGKVVDPMDTPGLSWDIFEIFTPEECKILFDAVGAPGFCAGLTVREGTQKSVAELRQHVDLFVVTSPFASRNWVYERDWWLEKHFGFNRREHVVHTSAKYLVDADICLDDKHSNVFQWHDHHPDGLAMIWPTHNTRNMPAPEGYLVRDWQDVIDRVKAHVLKPTALDLLDEREWDADGEGDPFEDNRVCRECGKHKHTPDCRLNEILTHHRRSKVG